VTLDEERRIGERAEGLLHDEVLSLVFGDIERDCISQWRNSPARDGEAREKIWQYLKMTDAIKLELRKRSDAGKMAAAKIEAENKARAFEKEHGHRPPV
jgi:hypothetical protein